MSRGAPRSTRAPGVLALIAALGLVACPRAVPAPLKVAARPDPTAFVPAAVALVGYLDLPTLLSRPGLKEESALVQRVVEKLRDGLGVDPALLRGATLFAGAPRGRHLPRHAGMILAGDLRGSPGLDDLREPMEHRGRTHYALGDRPARVAFLGAVTVLGDAASVREVIDVARGQAPSLPRGDPLWNLLASVGRFPFRLAFRLEGLRGLLARLPLPPEVKTLTAIAVGADIGPQEILGELSLPARDPARLATQIGGIVVQLTTQLRRSTFFRMLAGLLEGVRVQAAADRVSVTLRVPMGLARSVLPMVLGSLRLRP